VRLVSITITLAFDKPEVLRAYAEGFHASAKWLFLTGERAQIVKLANDDSWLSADTPGTVTHSDNFVLVDREGKVRGFFDGTKPESVPRLLEAIAKLNDSPTR
jgi:protein SCO1/2